VPRKFTNVEFDKLCPGKKVALVMMK